MIKNTAWISGVIFPDRGLFKTVLNLLQGLLEPLAFKIEIFLKLGEDFLQFLSIEKTAKLPHIFGLDIQKGVLTVQEGKDVIGLRRQEERLFTDILRILKADRGLA